MISMLKIIFLLVILLSACKTTQRYGLDAGVYSYVSKFEQLCGVHVRVPITIKEKLENSNWAGVCYFGRNGKRWIEISQKYWNLYDEYGREELIFHELGHCVLGRDHDDSLMDLNGYHQIPTSIMLSYTFGNLNYYRDNLEYYHKEICDARKLFEINKYK